jgi:hypothetical protein
MPCIAWLTPANSLKIIEASCNRPTYYFTARNSKGCYKIIKFQLITRHSPSLKQVIKSRSARDQRAHLCALDAPSNEILTIFLLNVVLIFVARSSMSLFIFGNMLLFNKCLSVPFIGTMY